MHNKIRSTGIATVARRVDESSHSAGCGCEANEGDSNEKIKIRSTCIATVARRVDESSHSAGCGCEANEGDSIQHKQTSIKTRITTKFYFSVHPFNLLHTSIKTRITTYVLQLHPYTSLLHASIKTRKFCTTKLEAPA